jgi:general secretion pathway protein G
MHLESKQKRRGGFTLVEILIVVIILGILAGIVIPQFSTASGDSRNSSVKSQLQTVRNAIQVYQMQHMDTLPDLSSGWTPLLTQTNPQGSTTGTVLVGPYLPSVPVNILTGGSNISTAAGAGVDWVWTAGTGKLSAVDAQGNIFNEAQ